MQSVKHFADPEYSSSEAIGEASSMRREKVARGEEEFSPAAASSGRACVRASPAAVLMVWRRGRCEACRRKNALRGRSEGRRTDRFFGCNSILAK